MALTTLPDLAELKATLGDDVEAIKLCKRHGSAILALCARAKQAQKAASTTLAPAKS